MSAELLVALGNLEITIERLARSEPVLETDRIATQEAVEILKAAGIIPDSPDAVRDRKDPKPALYPEIPPLENMILKDLETAELTPPCIVDRYLYADVAVFAGPGGTGKTTQQLYELVHIAMRWPLYGLEVRNSGAVLFVTAEDRAERIAARLHRIMDALNMSEEDRQRARDLIYIWDVAGETCKLIAESYGTIQLTGLADAIIGRFKDGPPVLIVFDPIVSFGASEQRINDNEQGLILAARRIVRALGCCVRFICHTGKEVARNKIVDQYAARGGSALADGSRMTAVLANWEAGDKLVPPPGFNGKPTDQVMVLARPKTSYAALQPNIWITRNGFAYSYQVEVKESREDLRAAYANQVETFLAQELQNGRYHTKNTLEQSELMPRAQLRVALAELEVSGRVIHDILPADIKRHGPRSYLRPIGQTSPAEVGEVSCFNVKNSPSAVETSPAETTSPPYRKKNGGEVTAASFLSPFPNFAGEPVAKSGEVGEVSDREAADGIVEGSV